MAIVLSISKHFGAVNALSKSLFRFFFFFFVALLEIQNNAKSSLSMKLACWPKESDPL